jgi:hypothetical protein
MTMDVRHDSLSQIACLFDPVIGRLFGDGDIVDVGFAHAGIGDAHELRLSAEFLERGTARVSHRRADIPVPLIEPGPFSCFPKGTRSDTSLTYRPPF